MCALSNSRMSRPLIAIAIAFAAACADYEDPAEPGELGQPGESAQNGEEASTDPAAVTPVLQATPDAGSGNGPDASVRVEADASALGADGGPVVPMRDAGNGRADAGSRDRDASALVDASSVVDASSMVDTCGTLTYASFGKQLMATYCVGCHSGANAKHNVQLDTLVGVQKNKAAIKRQSVTGTSMPSVDPKPSAAERQKLGQWLDCGPS